MVPETLRGLDDGFAEFQTATEQDVEDGIKSGTVAVDTNVLLNLYRYDAGPARELLRVLELLGERLFVSHQVASEFWRNRGDVIRQRASELNNIQSELDTAASAIGETLNRWRNRTGSTEPERDMLLAPIVDAIDAARNGIAERGTQTKRTPSTNDDDVLAELRRVLTGRVGHEPDQDVRSSDVEEGTRRANEGIAPGFRDADKDGDARVGDYLAWIQSLRRARDAGASQVVFVTDDANKGDWFEVRSGETLGPHRQLVSDAFGVANARLVLIRTPQLLRLANQHLNANVGIESIESIDAVASQSARWSFREISVFMELLAQHNYTQHQVISEASALGGRISRERIYELAGYSEDRTLRGFSRPSKTVMRQMIEDGTLSDPSVAEPLVAVYENPDSYVLASHYEVPAEFARWWLADGERGS